MLGRKEGRKKAKPTLQAHDLAEREREIGDVGPVSDVDKLFNRGVKCADVLIVDKPGCCVGIKRSQADCDLVDEFGLYAVHGSCEVRLLGGHGSCEVRLHAFYGLEDAVGPGNSRHVAETADLDRNLGNVALELRKIGLLVQRGGLGGGLGHEENARGF